MARWVRVCSINFEGLANRENNLNCAKQLIDKVLYEQPDLIVLPETFTALGLGEQDWFNTAEPLDGETVHYMCHVAAKHCTYIACPILLRHRSQVHNAVVFINRQGEIEGVYSKMFPTLGELDLGVTPGTEALVIETDFGKVGFAICFDLNFREVADDLHRKGAELVCFSSMYPGGMQLQHWALEYQWWMLSAIGSPQGMLVNPLGRICAQAQPNYQPLVCANVNMDCLVAHLDYNYDKLVAIKRRYGRQVQLDILQPEARFLLTCHDSDTDARQIALEHDLLLWDDYFARARNQRLAHLMR